MGNMGYCRFENTLEDLQDCYKHMDEKDFDESEDKARKRMIALCVDIALDYGHKVPEKANVDTEERARKHLPQVSHGKGRVS